VSASALNQREEVALLLRRLRQELGGTFDLQRPLRVSRAPACLDVMGGIAHYTGSMVCRMPLDRAAALALQVRADRQVQIFSFNLLDLNQPFTLGISLDALAQSSLDALRQGFAQPGRAWAAHLAGPLRMLHEEKLIDLADPRITGVNLAVLSTIPLGAGLGSAAAIEVATMIALRDHFALQNQLDATRVATLCRAAHERMAGDCGAAMDQAASCLGRQGMLLRCLCQPNQSSEFLPIPQGMCFIGIDSGVRDPAAAQCRRRTRCAAFMGHRIIHEKMRQLGVAAGKTMIADPMGGFLGNLDPEDYKRFFRPYVPEKLSGRDFTQRYGSTIDPASPVEEDVEYAVQQAVDHHVLEARRVRNFVDYMGRSLGEAPGTRQRGSMLDRAGHLMYASHIAYSNDALLGDPRCDLLVEMVRKLEGRGLYGARITANGCGGTVAVLAAQTAHLDQTIAQIVADYQTQTGQKAEVFSASSPGAWETPSELV